MMDEFREVHKDLTTQRDSMAAIDGLKADYARAQQEQATLVEKLDRAKKKVAEVPGSMNLLVAAGEVRMQLDERRRATEQLNEQKEQLSRTKDELGRAMDTLREVEAAAGVGTDAHIAQLEEEVRTNKFVLEQELPSEIAALKEWKGLLEEVLGEATVTEATRAMLHQELTQLRSSVKELTGRRAQQQQPSDEQLGVHRQQAAVFDRKKDELLAQLKTLQEELEAVRQEHAERMKQYEAAGGDARMLSPEMLEAFIAAVKAKAEEVKRLRGEMSDLKSEFGTLSRTLDILTAQDPTCKDYLAELEKKGGPSEPLSTQEQLEAVSQQKQKVDEAKGKTLAEISKIVSEISDALQEQKTKLAPLAKELRTLRNKFQEVESEHSEKKKEHDSLMLQIENERGKTDLEKKAYIEDWFREESRFHYHSCMLLLNTVQQAKATETALPREGEKTYQDVYAQRSKYLTQQIEIWRTQQKALKETAEPSLSQARQFSDLKKLMTLKLEILKKPQLRESTGVQEGGADRLVIA